LSKWLSARALNHPHACPLRIHLTPEEDARLRELETNPVVPFKVRRRAQAVRPPPGPGPHHPPPRPQAVARKGSRGACGRQAPRGQTPLDPGHERLPGGALGEGGGLDGPPAPGGFGEALLRDLPPGYGKAEAPGDGVPVGHAKAYVLTDPVCAHGETHGGGEGEVCGRPGGGYLAPQHPLVPDLEGLEVPRHHRPAPVGVPAHLVALGELGQEGLHPGPPEVQGLGL